MKPIPLTERKQDPVLSTTDRRKRRAQLGAMSRAAAYQFLAKCVDQVEWPRELEPLMYLQVQKARDAIGSYFNKSEDDEELDRLMGRAWTELRGRRS